MHPPRRIRKERPRRDAILIQCEGTTEFNYFDELRKDDRISTRFAITVKAGRGGDARVVVNEARDENVRQKRRGESYDQVWCVLDVEDISRTDALNEALNAARRHKLAVCVSNPCFEVWVLAHFERTSRAFANGNEVVKYVDKQHWTRVYGRAYDKIDRDLHARLQEHLQTAINNARLVLEIDHDNAPCHESNSSTEVFRLIETLRQAS